MINKYFKYQYFYFLLSAVFLLITACRTIEDNRNHDFEQKIKQINNASFSNPDSALKACNSLLADKKVKASKENTCKIHLQIASIENLRGNYPAVIDNAVKAKALTNTNTSPLVLAQINNELGVAYDYRSEYKKALDHYQLAQKYYGIAKDSIGLIKIINNIGLIHQNLDDLKKAKLYFIQAYNLSKRNGYENEQIMALSNLAAVENDSKNYSIALQYFKEVLNADIKSGNKTYISYSYNNIGEAYKNLNRYDSAEYYLQKAIYLKKMLGAKAALINSYKTYADLLINAKRYPEADLYLNEAVILARIVGTNDYLDECYFLKAKLAESIGNFNLAYYLKDTAYILKDSIANNKYKEELIVKEKDFELSQKNLELEKNKRAIDTATITNIFSFCIITVLIVFGIWVWINYKKQKKFIEILATQKNQIEQGLVLRNQFLSFMAHEIRNPLSGIIGLNRMLLSENPTPTQAEFLQYQLKSSEHLLALMNDVLDYQKVTSGTVTISNVRFSLKQLIQQVYNSYKAPIEDKKINFTHHFDDTIPPYLYGDPVRLTQVFGNLVHNAIKFTNVGTKVIVTATLIHVENSNYTILASVSDNGNGIPKEEQDKIFELYVQSSKNKSEQLGTGLGLGIVRNLLSLMNSHIQLQSDIGKGTTFSFEITLSSAPMSTTETVS